MFGGHSYWYNLWAAIKQRCQNPKRAEFRDYGGRGISVFPLWSQSFEAFLFGVKSEIGERPTSKHSIDRIDNNGNYEPGNIRWATKLEQNNNRRKRKLRFMITANGKTQSIFDWASETGIKKDTIKSRLKRNMPEQEAVTRPTRIWRHNHGL